MAATAAALVPAPAAAADKAIERFTAFAVKMGGTRGATAGTVDIVIERWSTAAERDRMTAALREKGSDGLLDEMRNMDDRVGYIRTAGSLGYPLRFAHQVPLASGGRRLLLGTDRPVSFLDTRRDLYPFMIIDIRLGPDGEGQGKLLPLARVKVHPDEVVEFEDYLIEPVRLTRVRKSR
jgi:hypothetical protein